MINDFFSKEVFGGPKSQSAMRAIRYDLKTDVRQINGNIASRNPLCVQ